MGNTKSKKGITSLDIFDYPSPLVCSHLEWLYQYDDPYEIIFKETKHVGYSTCQAATLPKLVEWVIFRSLESKPHRFNLIVSHQEYITSYELFVLIEQIYQRLSKSVAKKVLSFLNFRLLLFHEEWLNLQTDQKLINDYHQIVKCFEEKHNKDLGDDVIFSKINTIRSLLIERSIKECNDIIQNGQQEKITRIRSDPEQLRTLCRSQYNCRLSCPEISSKRQSYQEDYNINVITLFKLDDIDIKLSHMSSEKFTSREIAYELTLIEMEYLVKLSQVNLRDQIGQGIRMEDKISHWVTSEILQEKDDLHRKRKISYFYNMVSQLYRLKNFSSFSAVLFGLNHPALTRLNISPEIQKHVQDKVITLMENNWKNYRDQLKIVKGPIIPIFAILSKDLIYIDETNSKYWNVISMKAKGINNPEKKLINYMRLILMGDLFREIISWQSGIKEYLSFNTSNSEIREYLLSMRPPTSEEIWDLSYKIKERSHQD